MQWYLYLITIAATVFLSKVAVELISRPIQTVLRLRRDALAPLLYCRNILPPPPRELAVTSQEIRGYDQAVRNLRNAQRIFADLGARFLALSESEPTVRTIMALFGLDLAAAGHELINLSQIYATTTGDSDQFRRAIDQAIQAIQAALAVSRHHSHDALIKIRLEPMYPRAATVSRRQSRPLAKPRMAALASSHPQVRQRVRQLARR
jgi:hypothetical protein